MADCVVNWSMILEYLKVFFSWPAVTICGVLVAICFFKDAIRDRIQNTESLDAGGLKAKFGQGRGIPTKMSLGDNTTITDPGTNQTAADSSLQAAASVTVAAHAELTAPGHDERQRSESAIKERFKSDPRFTAELQFVVQQPAATVLAYRSMVNQFIFERAMNRIFGSQVRLLLLMASYDAQPLDTSSVRIFYNEFLSASKNAPYPMTSYLDFLINYNAFIKKVTDGNGDQYLIQPLGMEFIDYIRTNYPDAWDKRWA